MITPEDFSFVYNIVSGIEILCSDYNSLLDLKKFFRNKLEPVCPECYGLYELLIERIHSLEYTLLSIVTEVIVYGRISRDDLEYFNATFRDIVSIYSSLRSYRPPLPEEGVEIIGKIYESHIERYRRLVNDVNQLASML